MLGYSLGQLYIKTPILGDSLEGKPTGIAVVVILVVCGGFVFARLGSWIVDRLVVGGLDRFQSISPADKILGIIGVLLGLIFAVLLMWPFPNEPYWILIKLGAMIIAAAIGMALLQGMREEMINVFPQLEKLEGSSNAANPTHRVKLLDTNIIIDGRLAELCKTGFIDGPILVPTFILDEVQLISDSSDSLKRARGKRGLDILNAMRDMKMPQPIESEEPPPPMLTVYTDIPPHVRRIRKVDSKLVALAKTIGASIITNDTNLNRVAALQRVQVLNLNELTQALRPVVLPGEEMNILISREGKERGQGVGYLDDGTMIVVNDAYDHIGERCKINISSVIQTVAGKMIFAELAIKGPGDDLFDAHPKSHGNRSSRGSRNKN